jgi:hypothetical protein
MSDTWEPLESAEAAELIGEGIHTGLRKGGEAESSVDLWKAISESEDSAWSDALTYMVDGLEYMGYKLCTRVPAEEVDVTSGDENTGG